MDYAEKAAKVAVEALIPGAKMHYQVDQSTGQHDFDLEYADGRIAALEVTISTDQTQESTFAAITKPRKGGGASIRTRLCKKDWYAHPEPTARISNAR